MCGRFVSSSSPERIAAYFGAEQNVESLGENFNVAPTNDIYGVVADAGVAGDLDERPVPLREEEPRGIGLEAGALEPAVHVEHVEMTIVVEIGKADTVAFLQVPEAAGHSDVNELLAAFVQKHQVGAEFRVLDISRCKVEVQVAVVVQVNRVAGPGQPGLGGGGQSIKDGQSTPASAK